MDTFVTDRRQKPTYNMSFKPLVLNGACLMRDAINIPSHAFPFVACRSERVAWASIAPYSNCLYYTVNRVHIWRDNIRVNELWLKNRNEKLFFVCIVRYQTHSISSNKAIQRNAVCRGLTCYVNAFPSDTSDVIMQMLSHTILSGTTNALQSPSNLPALQTEPWTAVVRYPF